MSNVQAIRLLIEIIGSKRNIYDPDEQYVYLRIFELEADMVCRVCFYSFGNDQTIEEFKFDSFPELEERVREVTRR
jgi:hypothetical protein